MDPLTIHCVFRIPGYQEVRGGLGKPSRQGYRLLQTEGLRLSVLYVCEFSPEKGEPALTKKKKKKFKESLAHYLYYPGIC